MIPLSEWAVMQRQDYTRATRNTRTASSCFIPRWIAATTLIRNASWASGESFLPSCLLMKEMTT